MAPAAWGFYFDNRGASIRPTPQDLICKSSIALSVWPFDIWFADSAARRALRRRTWLRFSVKEQAQIA